ncbi:hypothetical protein GXW83_10880 [Streptacidiphilus sp. PB12-B1b]|uniref:hypothetical protein n=1 Tax=Streptacidiphilus sp. PB12-B1b TaxID=2705012 RepID=UPI0015FCF374|nr:hypothetical protein [Streptacidiphilus sp. PB12-B1b]QMU76167.1 hypothetical protein GXW83_10880 [Streptacidiphilus sp. PB12-B1b]
MRASDDSILEGGEFDGETLSAVFGVSLTLPSRKAPGVSRVYRDTGSYKDHKDKLLRVFSYRGDDGA